MSSMVDNWIKTGSPFRTEGRSQLPVKTNKLCRSSECLVFCRTTNSTDFPGTTAIERRTCVNNDHRLYCKCWDRREVKERDRMTLKCLNCQNMCDQDGNQLIRRTGQLLATIMGHSLFHPFSPQVVIRMRRRDKKLISNLEYRQLNTSCCCCGQHNIWIVTRTAQEEGK